MLSLLFVFLLTLEPIYSTNPQCSRKIFDRKDNYIIDIKASVVRGAELVNGMLEGTVDDCVRKCCEDSKCDLTLYRKDGTSKYGHNCYLVKCGIASNCVEARHNEFMLVPLEPYHDDSITWIGRENSPSTTETPPPSQSTVTYTHAETTESTSQTEPQTDSETTETTEITSQTEPHSTEVQADSETTSLVPVDDQNENVDKDNNEENIPTENENVDENEDVDETLENAKTPSPSSSSTVVSTSVAITTKISTIATQYPPPNGQHIPKEDTCKHGCNGGSGLIVIAVAGGIASLVIFFVAIFVGRRLYKNRQRKHYHNVDYLINGMYS